MYTMDFVWNVNLICQHKVAIGPPFQCLKRFERISNENGLHDVQAFVHRLLTNMDLILAEFRLHSIQWPKYVFGFKFC